MESRYTASSRQLLGVCPRAVPHNIDTKGPMSDVAIAVEAYGAARTRILDVLDLLNHSLAGHRLTCLDEMPHGGNQHHRRIIVFRSIRWKGSAWVARVKGTDELGCGT